MGPLNGYRIIELAGIGPGPFCGMLLADMGAEVIVVERKDAPFNFGEKDCFRRGKTSICLDLKKAEDREKLLALVASSDAIFEGFRPGVVEKLGIGPEDCMAVNERIVYGRMTGWGQNGPLAQTAGHDINYIALTGALAAIGPADGKPVPPLNLVGDFGGGGMFLAFGMVCAMLEAKTSGKGQVVDAAMTDGSAVLMTMFNTMGSMGMFSTYRGHNLLDGGAHFYGTYQCSDGKFVSVGAIEPQFYAQLLRLIGLTDDDLGNQNDFRVWQQNKQKLADVFITQSRDHWCEVFAGSDACFAPVLDYVEAQSHPHNVARGTYVDIGGVMQPAPAPRFSRTVAEVRHPPKPVGQDTEQVLNSLK